MISFNLAGMWRCSIPGQLVLVRLPGTLDENGVGFPDDPKKQWRAEELRRAGLLEPDSPIITRLTRKYTYEGEAVFSRVIDWERPMGKRLFVQVGRARKLSLSVNGRQAPLYRPASLSTPYCFEVTGLMTGHDRLTFTSDNSYPGWPRESIVYSSAASDETQTNWNGLLGPMLLTEQPQTFLSDVRVYPAADEPRAVIEIDAPDGWRGVLRLNSEAFLKEVSVSVDVPPGKREITVPIPIDPAAKRWDLDQGALYSLSVSGEGLNTSRASFGIRRFEAVDGCLTLNGRRVFLRGETDCAVYPETGHCPTDVESWRDILGRYRAYGVNFVRFHSHCPPEAAFFAADEMGMLLQPELSNWDPAHAFSDAEARAYYRTELNAILRRLANHPSFVMLSLGNELGADEEAHSFMDALLDTARADDPTRLYADGSNTHYGERGENRASGFYTAMRYRDQGMRATCDGMTGWLNNEYPNTLHSYDGAVRALRRQSGQPIFSFEVGQYETLPDFSELDAFRGVTCPDNLRWARDKAQAKGLLARWDLMARAVGECGLRCYQAEVEAALRTDGYSGIVLLGLKDFPGQGTALTGMMNAHLKPKPWAFALPERFAAFFRDTLPLALLERFTYPAGETVRVRVLIANYGKSALTGDVTWSLTGGATALQGTLSGVCAPAGGLKDAGQLTLIPVIAGRAARLDLRLSFCGASNSYPLWIYEDTAPVCPASVAECRTLDERARRTLDEGGTVYLAPDSTKEALPHSIRAQFSPDFWSVRTFPHQDGGMGQLIDAGHPIFRDFPTASHNDWQWWPMANGRAMLLPRKLKCIVEEVDSFATMRSMARLFEARCGKGRVLVSSYGLHRLQEYPEARALQRSIYEYLDAHSAPPEQEISIELLEYLTGSPHKKQ